MPRAYGQPKSTGEKCLAVCRDCSPAAYRGAAVIPFISMKARNEWAEEHAGEYGHEVGRVLGWPSQREAYKVAFGRYP